MEEQGVCKIKQEYILPEHERKLNLDHVSEKDKAILEIVDKEKDEKEHDGPQAKKQKTDHKNKKLKGQNKNRGKTFNQKPEDEICYSLKEIEDGQEIPPCPRKNCSNLHDFEEYLKRKPADIGPVCVEFEEKGKCLRGVTCRFGKSHISENGRNIVLSQKYEEYVNKIEKSRLSVINVLDKDLMVSLRKRTYNFDLAEKLIDCYDRESKTPEQLASFLEKSNKKTYGTVTDEDIVKLRSREKKKIDWSDKLYLSPLTTVGNLPFRRICKEFGVDITCGEMALCSSILQGLPTEWALMKRHHTEDLFGVQLCSYNAPTLVKCGELIQKECDVDFIDVNLGCPIEWIFKKGGGSGLILRPKILESCVRNLSDVLTIPMTVKTRTGAYKDQNIAHDLAPKFRDWGASLITIHGRSREQRYTKSADWAYIQQVAVNAAPLPVFGNGDVLSYEDYKNLRETAPALQGVMIGRGALIKPWIFTEIKEQKIWDISSKERFDIMKKYVNYGLEHWGTDTRGVENTRRFLLEWLSFLYRYVPVGLLERPPQKINERPPFYKGRDELETLMASPSAADWIKISEMLLGKVPEDFKFIPKHKANSYQ